RSTGSVASIQTSISPLGVFAGTENNFVPAGHGWTASRAIRLFGFFQRFSRFLMCHIVEGVCLAFQLLVGRTISFLVLRTIFSSDYLMTIPVHWILIIRPSNLDLSSPDSIAGLCFVVLVSVL